MTRHFLVGFILILLGVCAVFPACGADSGIISNEDGTFSMENGIFLRQYDGYGEEAQQFLSVLDACYSMIGSYSEIIDPYISGEKSFEDEQWNVIDSEIRYMSDYACSWIMQASMPAELAIHSYDTFYAASNLMIANNLLLLALRFDDESMAETASLFYNFAAANLSWLDH